MITPAEPPAGRKLEPESRVIFRTVIAAHLKLGVALSPDHDRYVEATRDAMAAGNTTVVVHAFASGQADQAADFLRARGGEVTSTL